MYQQNKVLLFILLFLLGVGVVWGVLYFLPDSQPTAVPPTPPVTQSVENSIEPTPDPTAVLPSFALPNCPTTHFAVIGDYGQDNEFAQRVANLVQQHQPDFVATVGDNNYPDGTAETIDEHIGKYYHQFIGDYQGSYGVGAETNNFYPVLGNHDWRTRSGDPPLPHVYLDYFTLPGNERYYNVVRDSVELFLLDTDENEPDGYTVDSEQAQWLKDKLAASTATWQIVVLHSSPYSSGTRHGSGEDTQWPFAEWGADIVYGGDEHNYERLQVDDIPYIVNGLSGSSGVTGFQEEPVAGSLVRYNEKHGAVFVEANCYSLTTQFINVDEQLVDHHTLTHSPLALDLTVNDDTPRPGQLLDYSLSIANHTGQDVEQTAVSITLPPGLEMNHPVALIGGTGQTAQDASALPYIAHDLFIPAGQTVTLSLPLLVEANLAQGTSLLIKAVVTATDLSAPAINTLVTTITFDSLIPRGSSWHYLDDGSDQGPAWYAASFDDQAWAIGSAPFSYEEDDDYSTVSFGSDEENKYLTTYFRKNFFVTNTEIYQALLLQLRRDDGAVVYLNGRELFRSNMPKGEIDYGTEAEETVSAAAEDTFFPITLDTSLLIEGWNVIAVEIHQSSPTSSDLIFDLALSGDPRPISTAEESTLPSVTPTVTMLATNDYYVAVNGRNEGGDGSRDNPWATIDYAVQHVSDGSVIWVQPGTYHGAVELQARFDEEVRIVAAVPYQARLRHPGIVLGCHLCRGIVIEGFDIAHSLPNADQYVIQIQDREGRGEGGRNITLRNNVLHDSYNDDIIKVNNGAQHITIENNIFYNQSNLDSHIDVNSTTYVTVQDNIFFNDFAGSNRLNNNNTGSLIVVKDSNGNNDGIMGSSHVTIRRNILLNWEGANSSAFIAIGEDSVDYYQAYDVLVENNLFLGNSPNPIRAAWAVKGSHDITFQNNTIVGDMPAKAFAVRVSLQDNNLINQNIRFYNNIWSDPTGTMGMELPESPNDFSDTLPEETESFVLLNNLYWNGGIDIPVDDSDLINYADDSMALVMNPNLPEQDNIVLPHWDEENGRFADNSATIREVFNRLVLGYGSLPETSPAIDQANPAFSPTEDILGLPRPSGSLPDIGAYEFQTP